MGRTMGEDDRSATDEAADWLLDYLTSKNGQASSVDAKRSGKVAGHAERTLRRAQSKLRIKVSSSGFPRVTYWSLPVGPTTEQQSRSQSLLGSRRRSGPGGRPPGCPAAPRSPCGSDWPPPAGGHSVCNQSNRGCFGYRTVL